MAVISYSLIMLSILFWSVTSSFTNGPWSSNVGLGSRMSDATTFSFPYRFLSSGVSSEPIWPEAPVTKIIRNSSEDKENSPAKDSISNLNNMFDRVRKMLNELW